MRCHVQSDKYKDSLSITSPGPCNPPPPRFIPVPQEFSLGEPKHANGPSVISQGAVHVLSYARPPPLMTYPAVPYNHR